MRASTAIHDNDHDSGGDGFPNRSNRQKIALPASMLPPPPALPDQEVYDQSLPLHFRYHFKHVTPVWPWQFGRAQYNQLFRFVMALRRPMPVHAHGVPLCTHYELYLSFLILNGGELFANGVSEAQHGSCICVQVESFVHAFSSFQYLTELPPLVQPYTTGVMVHWPRNYGYPEQRVVDYAVLIPKWAEVRELLERSALEAPRSLTNRPLTKGTELWRHWLPGLAQSQLHVGGAIPYTGLLDVPTGRMTRGMPPYIYD
eukprot:5522036-Amphidinium_carterae.3